MLYLAEPADKSIRQSPRNSIGKQEAYVFPVRQSAWFRRDCHAVVKLIA
jgi:hypothetical protein